MKNVEYRLRAIEGIIGNKVKAAQEATEQISILPHIASVYEPLYDDIQRGGHTTYYLPGGRGSCKSSFVSLELIDGIMKDPEANGIVFRAVGATLRDSVFTQCLWAVDVLGVAHLWKAHVSPMQMTYIPTGQVIIFRGLDDPLKLKSIRPPHGRFKYIWFEELCEISGRNKLRSVLQSVMRGGSGFRVFGSFNPPISRSNWCNVLVDEPDPRAITFRTDYTQVPASWLGDDFVAEAERLKEINPQAYRHEYLGEAVGSGGEVFANITTREITDDEIEQLTYTYAGVDFGFSSDPCAVIKVAFDSKKDTIFLLDEIYRRHCSNKELADMIKEKGMDKRNPRKIYYSQFAGGYVEDHQHFVADCAEPKSIYDLQGQGLKVSACRKFPGCVLYRIKWLQNRRIVIDPARTPNAHREMTQYEYCRDKDGEFLADVPDKNNHCIDALAYACDGLIYKKGVTA